MNLKILKIINGITMATIIIGIAIFLIGIGMVMQAQQDGITLSKLMNDSASTGTILRDNEHFYTVSYYLNTNLDLSTINVQNLTRTLIPLIECCNETEVKK